MSEVRPSNFDLDGQVHFSKFTSANDRHKKKVVVTIVVTFARIFV